MTDSLYLLNTAAALRLATLYKMQVGSRSRSKTNRTVSGSELAAAMTSNEMVESEDRILVLGNRLMRQGAIHGTHGQATFSPSADARYRFAVDDFALIEERYDKDCLMNTTRHGGIFAGLADVALVELCSRMRGPGGVTTEVVGVRVKSLRVGHLHTPSFQGSDAVDWMIRSSCIKDRASAHRVCSAMVHLGLFRNAQGKVNFKDNSTRFCFATDLYDSALFNAARLSSSSSCIPRIFRAASKGDSHSSSSKPSTSYTADCSVSTSWRKNLLGKGRSSHVTTR